MSIVKGLFGGSKVGGNAGNVAAGYNQQGIDEIRRQFNVTQENLAPYMAAGRGQINNVTQGTTAGGLDQRLAQIFNSDIFGSLVDERQRGIQGQLSAGGLTRSGTALQEAANVPTELGLMLEQLLTGRSNNLMASGQNAAANLGSFGANASNGIADLFKSTGSAKSSGMLADAQANAKKGSNLLNTAVSIGSMFFSDPRLKDNVEEIGEVSGLKVYQWDWKDITKGTLIENCGTMGFMADEVKEKYPHHVYDFCGHMVIDYPELLDELEAA